MAIATLMILVFHVWIPVFSYGSLAGNIERFLISSSYVGVDIFFFVSAYSLSSRPVEILSRKDESSDRGLGNGNGRSYQNYKKFIVNRALKLLPLFVIAWAFGHFMWFIPSLMIVYLIFPPLYKLCEKKPMISLVLLLIGWAVLTWLIMAVIKPHEDIGIFLFRIPIIIIGAYAAKVNMHASDLKIDSNDYPAKMNIRASDDSKQAIVNFAIGILTLAVGVFLTYKFGYIDRLDFPFKGAFYLVGIPVTIGLALIVSFVSRRTISEAKSYEAANSSGAVSRANENVTRTLVRNAFANASLETYFMQMVIGSKLVGTVFGITGSKLLTNFIVMAIIILLAILLSKIYPKITKRP